MGFGVSLQLCYNNAVQTYKPAVQDNPLRTLEPLVDVHKLYRVYLQFLRTNRRLRHVQLPIDPHQVGLVRMGFPFKH